MRLFFCITLFLNILFAQIAHLEIPLVREGTDPAYEIWQTYIADEEKIPVYKNSTGEELVDYSVKLGELFFALKEEQNRVYVGKYNDATKKFELKIGWINHNSLIKKRLPNTVQEAIQGGFIPESSNNISGSFSVENTLYVRVLTKPQQRVTPAKKIGEMTERTTVSFAWYYVHKIKKHEGKVYYLISAYLDLISVPFVTGNDINGDSSEQRLLGWIENTNVQILCSNIVYDFNTSEEAVTERLGEFDTEEDDKPANIYSQPDETSPIVATEAISLFLPHFQGSTDIGKLRLARPDPFGYAPEISRVYIIEKENDDWCHGASIGSEGVSSSTIAELLKKLGEAESLLSSIDLVFVIDATGSMSQQIETVTGFIHQLSETLAQLKESNIKIQFPGTNELIDFVIKPTIKISLIAYQDIGATGASPFNTKVVFKGKDIPSDIKEIEEKTNELGQMLAGGTEAIHDGLICSLTEAGIWRDYSTRMLVVIGDEPGDSGDLEQEKVLQNMPIPKKEHLTEFGLDFDMPEEEAKKTYTEVYGIFAKSNWQTSGIYNFQTLFDQYKYNLRMITNHPVIAIDFTNANFRNSFHQELSGRVNRAMEDVQLRIKDLAQKIHQKSLFILNISLFKETLNQSQLSSDLLSEFQNNNNALPSDMKVKVLKPDYEWNISNNKISYKLEAHNQLIKVYKQEGNIFYAAQQQAAFKITNTSIAELRQLADVAFISGYVKLQQTNHLYPSYKPSVILARQEVVELQDMIQKFSNSLANALNFQRNTRKTPKQIVAEAVLYAVAEVGGFADEYQNNPYLLTKEAKEIIDNPSDESIKERLQMQTSLPVKNDGLLGMPIREVVEMKISDIKTKVNQMKKKSLCFKNILENLTIPEDYQQIENHQAKPKTWTFPHPVSKEYFICIVLDIIP